jgi:signal peptidase I
MADDNLPNVSNPNPPGAVPPAPAAPAPGQAPRPPDAEAPQAPPNGAAPAAFVPSTRPERKPAHQPAPNGNGPLRKVAGFFWRPRKAADAPPQAPTNTLREVLETVVFVVVLVVLLKSFAAEAFVIPTGSMATTLLGRNEHVKCPQCGAEFPVNASQEKGEDKRLRSCTCYNCRYKIDFARDKVEAYTSAGDRVLVAKFLSDLGLMAIKPLDVVVFKFPEEPVDEDFTPKNYIKRAIGMPDKTVGIFYGDIYIANREDLIKKGVSFETQEGERDLPLRRQMHMNEPRALELLEQGDPVFQILRKPAGKIEAMMRPVYDIDHPARDLEEANYPPRWAPEADDTKAPDEAWGLGYLRKRQRAQEQGTPWKADDARGFVFGGGSAAKTWWLRYRNLVLHDRDNLHGTSGRRPELITDFLSYNTGVSENGETQERANGQRWVGDLILECEVKVDKAEGNLVLELSKGPERFQARFDLATNKCTLFRGNKELGSRENCVGKPGTYRLRFANVDRRLTVWVNRSLPFADGVNYDPPKKADGKILHGPNGENDLEPASIGAEGGASLSVHKLRLWRDTYYTVRGDENRSQEVEFWRDPEKWSGYEVRGMTMYVQPGHYLCLGDNSPASSDSRTWEKGRGSGPGGLVPERLMLGRALLVYWPLSRAGRIK